MRVVLVEGHLIAEDDGVSRRHVAAARVQHHVAGAVAAHGERGQAHRHRRAQRRRAAATSRTVSANYLRYALRCLSTSLAALLASVCFCCDY